MSSSPHLVSVTSSTIMPPPVPSAAAPKSRAKPAAATVAEPCLWDMDDLAQLHDWMQAQAPLAGQDPNVSQLLWTNLTQSLEALHEVVEEQAPQQYHDDDRGDADVVLSMPPPQPPANKKSKRVIRLRTLQDPYHIWLQAWKTWEQQQPQGETVDDRGNLTSATINNFSSMPLTDDHDDVPSTRGGKLSQLSIGGLINAFAAVLGGCVSKPTPLLNQSTTAPMASAANLSLHQLHVTAIAVHRAIQTRIRADILRTTPFRIQQLLAPDLTTGEFAAVRKRVYETVMLGHGMRNNATNNNDDDGGGSSDLATAPPGSGNSSGLVEAFKLCKTCGNNDQTAFVLDAKNGDVICQDCGTVVSESIMHEGSQFRKFEGEVDRNHHGDSWNPLYSNSHNLSTTLGGMQVSGGINGWGAGSKRNLETILRNAHAYTELNVSQFGKTDRKTRVGYKDKHKRDAFGSMQHVGDALNLHEAVIQRAKQIFAGFRDDRELVQQSKAVIAACLCEAFEFLSQSGKAILKQDEVEQKEEATVVAAAGTVSARGARRNELHSATLAGKGGLMIDFSNIEKGKLDAPTAVVSSSTSPKAVEKPTAAWDLLDCRSWLLDASRRIAQQWVEDRSKLEGMAARRIPAGTVDELEGKLVEHSIMLCEYLESELQARTKNGATKRSIHTPRANDMSKLSIKWQQGNERGMGGKISDKAAAASSGRTAGQILILLTAKKLSTVLNDEVSGDAFHKELRGLIAKQEELKRQKKLEEASRQRLHQMKRKPYLHARVMS